METFKLEPDERVLKKGSMSYVQGEPTLKNYWKGKASVTECTVFLTSSRFVACKQRKFFPWGPLIWLVILLRKRRIVFAIPLANLASIKDDGGSAVLLRASDGSEYRMAWTSLFANKDKAKWVRAVTDAVVAACAGTKAQASQGGVEFVK